MDSKLVYLVQTDTTVGFSSSDDEKLSALKQRPPTQKILQTVDSFKTLNQNTRVPKKFRKRVRNSKKTTYIYPNKMSFRVISKKSVFYDFIHKFNILYSTSANKTGRNYDKSFANEASEIIVEDKNNFFETTASKIIKINKSTIFRIR
jgi:tRNA A37 threonylcarbamoyladenosine synthetase subunit TsaC/SUA5/YrdC